MRRPLAKSVSVAPRSTSPRGLPSAAPGGSEGWSGRRGSNPRPTAWKAVTLPLSYSRLRARSATFIPRYALRRAGPPRSVHATHFTDSVAGTSRTATSRHALAGQPSLQRKRRLVAREGLEPSKPLGRQIYSLLRLTASLPRQLVVVLSVCRGFRVLNRTVQTAQHLELAKGFEPPTC
jgi:hypothetical protein